ncbi:LysR family transcriptional regulator [Streptomyces mirabilis]|uniref:LysR family transcriptional regulator n=1 Tax=Streptomyces mirabilis TaxID=68239 RepID=UPI0028F73C1B|nr:LysR family transcriptional regulator [Streptomyces mirabilis]
MEKAENGSISSLDSDNSAPQGVELRHLRYFVAVAEAGTFTHAAERMYVGQPTLSQQIRRLEEFVGTPLLHRRREGVRLTEAGTVLLEESRAVLSLVDHGVSRTRQAAGLGRSRLRFVVQPYLPPTLAAEVVSRLRSAAPEVDVTWLETSLDADFSSILQRRADAALGWMSPANRALPDPLDVMDIGSFEPDVWIPARHRGAANGAIGLDELARMHIIHGPRDADPGTYDAWRSVLQVRNPSFDFIDPPFWQSLPMTLAFAATGRRPSAVLTGPCRLVGIAPQSTADAGRHEMVPVRVEGSPLTATVGLVWSTDLPRELQQVLFETAEKIAP